MNTESLDQTQDRFLRLEELGKTVGRAVPLYRATGTPTVRLVAETSSSRSRSKEADAAFMTELQRTNPERYRNLIRNMQKQAGRLAAQRKQEQVVEAVEHRPLLRRKYGTLTERLDAERASHAAAQSALRQRQNGTHALSTI